MNKSEALSSVIRQFTQYNPTLIDCVNKRAITMDSFKESIYEWMQEHVPEEFWDDCYQSLIDAAWDYDILKPLICDDGSISDIACHAWDNVWIQIKGEWKECDFHFRDEDHYQRFFRHVVNMNHMTISERNASDNCTDISTCPDFRLRLNFIHHSINTDGNDVFSIRKIPTHKKTLEVLASDGENMFTPDTIPIIRKHLSECTGFLVVGMGGSGKSTFLNALVEELPKDWKFLFIQENEEIFSHTRRNSDFLKTVKGINEYDVAHDLKELARNGLLMSIKCFVVGEIKGEEALYLLNVTNTGAVGAATLHSDSAEHGLDKLADYVMYSGNYNKDQAMEMLTTLNKVFFLEHYRLKQITTIVGYDSKDHKLLCTTEYYNT